MHSDIAEGYYTGKIQNAYLSAFDENETELVMVFDVELQGDRAGGEMVIAKSRTKGDYPGIAVGVAAMLGLDWPGDLENIESAIGKDVPIRIKHKTADNGTVYVNAYIQTPRRNTPKPLTPDTAKRLIEELAGKPGGDDIPF